MRALVGHIPRAFKSHKTPEGHAYGRYVRAVLDRLGDLPVDAMPTLRQAGRITVELERMDADLDAARAGRRRRDQNRIRRQQTTLRSQLVTLERRLEEIASRQPTDLTRALRGQS